MTQVKGIDISSNNHNGMPFNWQDAKAAGYEVVYIKATQDDSYVNPYLIGDVKDAVAAGLRVGIYHMYGTADPTKQADWFISNGLNQQVDGSKPLHELLTILPMVDVEGPAGQPSSVLETFVNEFLTLVPSVGYMDRNNYSIMKPNFSADWIAWPGWVEADGTSYDGVELEIVQIGQALVPGIGVGPTGKQLLTDIDTILDLEQISIGVNPTPAPTLEDMSVMDSTVNADGSKVVYAISVESGTNPANHLYEFTKAAPTLEAPNPTWHVDDITDEIAAANPTDPPFLVQP